MINCKNKAIYNEETLKNKATCISDEEAITNEETLKDKAISDKEIF